MSSRIGKIALWLRGCEQRFHEASVRVLATHGTVRQAQSASWRSPRSARSMLSGREVAAYNNSTGDASSVLPAKRALATGFPRRTYCVAFERQAELASAPAR
jgi:hypothetical protein